jgi:hypothetical protein
MGLIAVVAFTIAIHKGFSPQVRIGLVFIGFVALIVIFETIAKQGYFAFLAGFGVVSVIWLFQTKRKKSAIAVSGLGAISGCLVLLALTNVGPLASYIYKGSLAARGFYWDAAFKMLTSHPFFGVGMDGFIDWYRRTRSPDYFKDEFFSFSNTAHNVFLDIASSGGYPLIALYVTVIALVVISIFRILKRSDGFDVYFSAVVGAWVAYQAQSFVSINQLGLAIWGWVLSGLIIGYELNTRTIDVGQVSQPIRRQQEKKAKVSKQQLNPSTVVLLFGGFITAALVSVPPYYANASFFSAIKSGDVKKLQLTAYLKPLDEKRLLHIATILHENNYDNEALAIAKDGAKRYSNSFDFWQLLSSIPIATSADISQAKMEMKRLDPFNPDL